MAEFVHIWVKPLQEAQHSQAIESVAWIIISAKKSQTGSGSAATSSWTSAQSCGQQVEQSCSTGLEVKMVNFDSNTRQTLVTFSFVPWLGGSHGEAVQVIWRFWGCAAHRELGPRVAKRRSRSFRRNLLSDGSYRQLWFGRYEEFFCLLGRWADFNGERVRTKVKGDSFMVLEENFTGMQGAEQDLNPKEETSCNFGGKE